MNGKWCGFEWDTFLDGSERELMMDLQVEFQDSDGDVGSDICINEKDMRNCPGTKIIPGM